MGENRLGRLKKIDLRECWIDEAQDFTPWLALPENLEILGDTLGMELEPVNIEQEVGPYKADILARDLSTNTYVIVENQLEKTDHSHLGQLITYSAGLEAKTIVWIAKKFTDEHRAAFDWLNQISEEFFNFFGIEVELWKIGESPPAPQFNIISQPNEWTKSIHASRRAILTEAEKIQINYWKSYNEFLENSGSILKPKKPYKNWMPYSIGKSNFKLVAKINQQKKWISVEIWIAEHNRDSYFHQLKEKFERLAAEKISPEINWLYRPNRSDHIIRLLKTNTDPTNLSEWPEQHEWIEKNIVMFRDFFSTIIKELIINEAED